MSFPCRHVTSLLGLSDRCFAVALTLGSLGLLASVYIMQYGFGYHPCEMCLWQRYPVFTAVGLGILGSLFYRHPLAGVPLRLLAGACYAVGAGIALFHTGVEAGWWEGLTGCSGGFGDAGSLDDLYERMMNAPSVRCDDVQFRLFGLSLAAWNVIASTLIALTIGLTLRYRKPRHAG